MNRLIQILILMTAMVAAMVHAAPPGSTYTAVVPVADNSAAERVRAIRLALEQVLIRLTGTSTIATYPGVNGLLANAASYTLEFGYVNLEPPQQGQGISVSFTGKELDKFLRQQQLPVWPLKRIPLLVWVVKESPGLPKSFLTQDDDQAFYTSLGKLLEARGMPVSYPIHDLEDQQNLPVEDAWGFDTQRLAEASKRYGAEKWLVVRCDQTSDTQWRLAWMLGGGDKTAEDNLDAKSLDEGLQQVVHAAVDRVAADYAYIPSLTSENLVLEVSGVENYAIYRKLMNVIAGLSMVESATVQSVAKDRVEMLLKVEGDQQVLVDGLSLYDQLSLVEQDLAGDRIVLEWQSNPYHQ